MIDREYIKDLAITNHSVMISDEKANNILKDIRSSLKGSVCLRSFVKNKVREALSA